MREREKEKKREKASERERKRARARARKRERERERRAFSITESIHYHLSHMKYQQNSAIHQKSSSTEPYIQEAHHVSKNLSVLLTELYVLSKRPYILPRFLPTMHSLYSLSKEPYDMSKEPYDMSKEPCIPSTERYIQEARLVSRNSYIPHYILPKSVYSVQ